ncbi:hypothetical protein GGS20DRAFT_578587 [Poronia punctata]|nr:hypothetical protein GGS20DRAFT_578587 [Poronia punctata]
MAPIPVYTNSPITAAKPDGVTPKTATAESMTGGQRTTASPTSTHPPPTQATAASKAQPGAVPSHPYAPVQPTPTTSMADSSPAPPQPGSTPFSSVPPPPKTGERYQPPVQTPAPVPTSAPAFSTATTVSYPHQMSIPAPTAPPSWQHQGTATATQPSSAQYGAQFLPIGRDVNADGARDLSHPSGYHQNANASELDRYQRSAMEQPAAGDNGDGSDGVWGAAKKLAQQTGERLAAVESEVWKKINRE